MNAVFIWNASKRLLEQELVETGKTGTVRREAEFDTEAMDSSHRQAILALSEIIIATANPYLRKIEVVADFDSTPVLDELIHRATIEKQAANEKRAAEKANLQKQAEYNSRLNAYLRLIDTAATLDDLNAVLQQHGKEFSTDNTATRRWHEQENSIKRDLRNAERMAWINTHGSAYLRRAFDAGYDCQRQYVVERAAMEAPGFIVDFYDGAKWSPRSMPSMTALDAKEEADNLGLGNADVVWLTDAPVPNRMENEVQWYGECEAVVIRRFLDKYDLVKIID